MVRWCGSGHRAAPRGRRWMVERGGGMRGGEVGGVWREAAQHLAALSTIRAARVVQLKWMRHSGVEPGGCPRSGVLVRCSRRLRWSSERDVRGAEGVGWLGSLWPPTPLASLHVRLSVCPHLSAPSSLSVCWHCCCISHRIHRIDGQRSACITSLTLVRSRSRR